MEKFLREEQLKPSDEAWLVVDKDLWEDSHLVQLFSWSEQSANYGFALSNPMFEYWLLLHFEEGKDIHSASECRLRLKRHLPNYDKSIDPFSITREMIEDAIRRAKNRDTPPCADWPRTPGSTTVYKLVGNILNSGF